MNTDMSNSSFRNLVGEDGNDLRGSCLNQISFKSKSSGGTSQFPSNVQTDDTPTSWSKFRHLSIFSSVPFVWKSDRYLMARLEVPVPYHLIYRPQEGYGRPDETTIKISVILESLDFTKNQDFQIIHWSLGIWTKSSEVIHSWYGTGNM